MGALVLRWTWIERGLVSLVVVGVLAVLPLSALAGPAAALQQDNDDFEPNDGFSSATPLEPDTTVSDLQIVDGESDYFAVDLEAGESLTASIGFSHGQGDLDLAVYGPDETRLGSSISVTDDEAVSVTADQAGTYYVEVYGFAGASAPYSLTTSVSGGDGGSDQSGDQFEPNDDFGTAAGISAGQYDGLQIRNGESDFFAVELADGQELTAAIEFSHSTGDLDLRLYGPDREPVDSSVSVSDGEAVSVTADQAGTYYVEVYGFAGASAPYSLDVSVAATDGGTGTPQPDGGSGNDRTEPNDGFSAATPVSPGSYSDLQIADGESDYFAVELEAGQRLTATVDFSHSTGDLDLAVYGPDRSPLESSLSVSDGEEVSITADQSGTYYVEIYGFAGASAPYSLAVSVADGSGDGDSGDDVSLPDDLDLEPPEPYNVSTTPIAADSHDFVFEITFEPNQNYYGDQSTDPHNLAGPINVSTVPDDGVRVNVYRKTPPSVGGDIFGAVALGTVSVATGGTAGIAVEVVSTGSDVAQAISNANAHERRRGVEHYSLSPANGVFQSPDPPNVTYVVHIHSDDAVDQWGCNRESGQYNVSYNYLVPDPEAAGEYVQFTSSTCVTPTDS